MLTKSKTREFWLKNQPRKAAVDSYQPPDIHRRLYHSSRLFPNTLVCKPALSLAILIIHFNISCYPRVALRQIWRQTEDKLFCPKLTEAAKEKASLMKTSHSLRGSIHYCEVVLNSSSSLSAYSFSDLQRSANHKVP